MRHFSVLMIIGLAISAGAQEKDILVGVSYFAGWWEASPNKWHGADGADWRPRYPDRMPLLGLYNNQETMDKEIRAAADYGVDFFSILWYYNPPGKEREPNSRFLERGVLDFMHSPENHRMRFMVEYCNHPPYDAATEEDWARCIEFWKQCFAHPSYLRIEGKIVFKVHGAFYFYQQNQAGPAQCRKRLDQLREAVRQAGLGEMILGGGVGSGEAIPEGHWADEIFDFTGTYMDLPDLPRTPEDYPYQRLAGFIADNRRKHKADHKPYLPFIAAGWAPRPWPDSRAYFAFPTKEEWTAALEGVRADLNQCPALGFPGQRAFTIYAWNEFGEGGILAPTEGARYERLEAIRKIFASSPQNTTH
mgnify:CR=1 FL=1